jgi:hypothetical protein
VVVIAVIFVRGERWDPARKLEDQDGLDGHVEFIRRNRDLGVVIEGAPFHDPGTQVTEDPVGLALLDMDSADEARRLVGQIQSSGPVRLRTGCIPGGKPISTADLTDEARATTCREDSPKGSDHGRGTALRLPSFRR